ncbi:MAG: NUDIX hydrolase [Kiritimatiellae bacterium]|nr:NUDIX hydrolase [Kiritimatiellia bacterium]MCO5061333.1 NUDIX hydrolase [Kiritimatiellia bacterium]MCO5067590.1 NUDIX hydrolase [Kiritimatiellia bacterium]
MSGEESKREVLHEGRWLRFVRERDWEFVEHRSVQGIAVVIALTSDDRLLLVEQERIPLGRSVIELPAGLIGDTEARAGEDFADAARRELLEETGYSAERVQLVYSGPMSPGRSADQYSFFRADGVARVHAGGGDETEAITVHAIPRAEIHAWLRAQQAAGRLIDPKIFVGLYLLQYPNAI